MNDDYVKCFIMKAQPDDMEDGNAERSYVIHMPYKTPHMEKYDYFWAWANRNKNLIEHSYDDFPRSYLRFSVEGDEKLQAEFEGYIGGL